MMRLPRRHRHDPAVALGALLGLALSYFLLSDRNILLAAIAFDVGLVLSLVVVRLAFREDRERAAVTAGGGSGQGADIVNLTAAANSQDSENQRCEPPEWRNAA